MWKRRALGVAEDVAAVTVEHGGAAVVGVYAIGSIAFDDVGPRSDVDVIAVVDGAVDVTAVAGAVVAVAEAASVRGVEFAIYAAADLRPPTYPLRYVLNVNAGREMETSVTTGGDPAHWFLLDIAGGRDHAVALRGPALASVCDEPARSDVLSAVRHSLLWHIEHEAATANAVLNAARSLRYVRCGDWLSKSAAGTWALAEPDTPPVVDQALRHRAGGVVAPLPPSDVEAFLRQVLAEAEEAYAGM